MFQRLAPGGGLLASPKISSVPSQHQLGESQVGLQVLLTGSGQQQA